MTPERQHTVEEMKTWRLPAAKRNEAMKKREAARVMTETFRSPAAYGKIASWPKERREQFQRDILAKMAVRKISEKYDIAVTSIQKYKQNWLMPAVAAASQNENLELQRSAQDALWWLYNDSKAALTSLRDGTGDPKRLGTYEQLLGRAADAVRTIAEVTGELKTGPQQAAPEFGMKQVIKVISIPKIEGTPAFAMSVEHGPDYSGMKLLEDSDEEE